MKKRWIASAITWLLLEAMVNLSYGQISPSTDIDGITQNQPVINIQNSLNRTALFPGDSVIYTLEIICAPGIDILVDDVAADELTLTGLELISSQLNREESEAGITYTARFHLATFDTGPTVLNIGEQTVRYYNMRPGQRLETVTTVGEIIVPEIPLALRSTLAAELPFLKLRDERVWHSLASWSTGTGSMGLFLILLSGVPIIFIAFTRKQQANVEAMDQNNKVLHSQAHNDFAEIQKIDPENSDNRRQGYDLLDKLVKSYLNSIDGIVADALTANEIAVTMQDQDNVLPEDMIALLQDCEVARYGNKQNLPSSERFQSGLSILQTLLNE